MKIIQYVITILVVILLAGLLLYAPVKMLIESMLILVVCSLVYVLYDIIYFIRGNKDV